MQRLKNKLFKPVDKAYIEIRTPLFEYAKSTISNYSFCGDYDLITVDKMYHEKLKNDLIKFLKSSGNTGIRVELNSEKPKIEFYVDPKLPFMPQPIPAYYAPPRNYTSRSSSCNIM